VVGGVAAELGGGKFANGGMSAAFSRMFNEEKSPDTLPKPIPSPSNAVFPYTPKSNMVV
jgi:hypothetical protein